MKNWLVLATVAVVFVFPSVAVGQPCPPVDVHVAVADQAQTWWMVLLDFLVQLSAPIVTAVLGVLGTWVVRKLARKWDSEKQEAVIRLTESMITSGVAFAEEQARKALRVGNVRTESAEKLQSAVDFIQQRLDASGLPGIAQQDLVNLIESRLHQERSKPDGVIPSEPADSGTLLDETVPIEES